MKNWILLVALASLAFLSCGDDDAPVATTSVQIEEYLTANSITDTSMTSSGLIYIIEEPGGTEKPTLSSTVSAYYTGTITDGTFFDGTTDNPASFPLNRVILAWQEGLQLVGRGGKILLICPPELAYGNNPPASSTVIKAGSVLVFDVELVDF